MRILLIDADSKIPNLPLMKLSTYHKRKGDVVRLIRLNIPYFPDKIKKRYQVFPDKIDKMYCSTIFPQNKDCVQGDGEFGGTGISVTKTLPEDIEKLPPDYSLYPDNDISYGFITRGCIRNCSFCLVPKKEGQLRQVAMISEIVFHKKVKFLDNNILAFPGHEEILKELVAKKINCQFNQGLDLRCVNNSNSLLLRDLNYLGDYIFAFDHLELAEIFEEKLQILNWRKAWRFKFFVYVSPEHSFKNIIQRIKWLHVHECLSYIMRDFSCYESPNRNFYIDLASWCNQTHIYRKMGFLEYLSRRHKKERISKQIWLENGGF